MEQRGKQDEICWQEKKSFSQAEEIKPAQRANGSLKCDYGISTFTQFDPLRSVIVGYIDETARIIQDYCYPESLVNVNISAGSKKFALQVGPFPPSYIQQGKKNLNALTDALMEMGIQVVRVGEMDFGKKQVINGVQTTGNSCFSPRDLPFIYGNSLYEFPMTDISRSNQYKCFEWIQKQLKENGSKIYSAWAPQTQGFRFKKPQNSRIFEKQAEYFADAANLIKVGLDILFLVSLSGSKGCYYKFKSMMQQKYKGVVRVHPLINTYQGYHVDTTYSIVGWNKKIQKFIVVANGQHTNPINAPALFRGSNWAILEVDIHKLDKQYFDQNFNYVTDAIGMNFLTINSELVVITPTQKRLKKQLQFYGIRSLCLDNKHTLQFAGGFHCATNDINRQDTFGFAKVLSKKPQELTLKQRAGLFDQELLQFLQSKGSVQEWTKICNQNKIFPQYLTDHLTSEQKDQMENKHKSKIQQFQRAQNLQNIALLD